MLTAGYMAKSTNMIDVQNLSRISVHLQASICSSCKKGEYPRTIASSTGKMKLVIMPSGVSVINLSVLWKLTPLQRQLSPGFPERSASCVRGGQWDGIEDDIA